MRTRPLPTASSITSPLDDPSAKKVTRILSAREQGDVQDTGKDLCHLTFGDNAQSRRRNRERDPVCQRSGLHTLDALIGDEATLPKCFDQCGGRTGGALRLA